jgi:hypothetical protein
MWKIDCASEEQEEIRIVEDHLRRLVQYAEDFSSALSLFNFCEQFDHRLTGKWPFVAARDGAMTIYHIGKTIELTRAALKRTPTLAVIALGDVLADAGKKYRQAFPAFEKVRHAVSHSSELFRDKEHRAKNAFSGSYDDGYIRIEGATNVILSNGLMGRNYTNTIDGKIISYEISEGTKIIVYDCVNTFISAFKPAYDTYSPWPEVPAPRL